MWKPTEHASDELERFRERRASVADPLRRLPRALPREPRDDRSRDALEVDDGDARLARDGRRDRRRRRRLPRRLAPRRRPREGTGASRPGAPRAARADGRPPLAPARELRGCGRHDRALDGRARRPRRPPRPASAARRLPRLVPLVGVRSGRHRPRRAGRRPRAAGRDGRPRSPALPAPERRGRRPRVEPRPPRLARRRDDGLRPGNVPRPPRRAGAARDPRDRRSGRNLCGRAPAAQAAPAQRAAQAARALAEASGSG